MEEIYENEDYKYYIKNYKFFFVSDIHEKNTIDKLKNLINNINTDKTKVYLLGYNNN